MTSNTQHPHYGNCMEGSSRAEAAAAPLNATRPGMSPLPLTYTPSPYDVICSKGKKSKNHSGNIFIQTLIAQEYTTLYAKADNKFSKSILVSKVMDTIRQKSSANGNGRGFIKQDAKTGQWYELGDVYVREKVSQWLRDTLKGQYKSSADSKKRRREENTNKMYADMAALATSDSYVSKRIRRLSNEIDDEGSDASDYSLMTIMTRANSDILNQLNDDQREEK